MVKLWSPLRCRKPGHACPEWNFWDAIAPALDLSKWATLCHFGHVLNRPLKSDD